MRTHLLPSVILLSSALALGCGAPPPPAAKATTSPAAPPRQAPPTTAAPAAAKPSLDERRAALQALLTEHWEARLATAPELATVLGDHRYADRWTDLSATAIAARNEQDERFLARFAAIDPTDFPEQERLSHRLMVRDLKESIDNARFEEWLMPIDQFGGVHLGLAQLPAMLTLSSEKDYLDYLKRLDGVKDVLAKTTALLSEGIKKKLVPPKILLTQCVEQALALARGKPQDSPFYEPAKRKAPGMPPAQLAKLRKRVADSIRVNVQPAYAALAAFLRDTYVPAGRDDPGMWALPDGAERYAARVRQATTTDLSPVQLHELGRAEVARIEDEQAAIGKKLGFANLDAFRAHIRKNRKLYAKSEADILGRYKRHTAAMYEKLPQLFGRLPAQRMQIEKTESFRQKQAAAAEYQLGAPDGSRPGVVRVNTYKATSRLWIDMESTAYHEGVPGHHFQSALQQELRDLPPFRKLPLYIAFSEGWALYAERLGKEVGLYRDPYSDYGRLQDEMLRAIRLVVDTGFHAKKWPRDKVVQFFRDHSTIDETTIAAETDRYIAVPGQALGYKVGQLTISRLREKAQGALGAAFDVRAFHDRVLEAGALPLDVLEERIDAWLAAAATP